MSLTRLLIVIFINDRDLPKKVVRLVESKVDLFDEREIPKIWARIKSEFRADRGVSNFPVDSPVLPSHFLEATSVDEMRHKIASYVLELKPRLIADRLSTDPSSSSPAASPDLAFVLTARTVDRLAFTELQLLRALSNLLRSWTSRKRDLLDALGLNETSWVARSSEMWAGTGLNDEYDDLNADIGLRTRIRLLRRVLLYADANAHSAAPLEKTLLGYRLGLEVSAPDISVAESKKPELQLQRDLARFLLERGHFAVGTKFGRAETDLLVAEGGDVIVIEAKKYTRAPTSTSLTEDLAQLQVYLSNQKIPSSRGILLIYNFSDRFVFSTRRWIRQQFSVLPVNLGKVLPSEARETLTVEESTGDNLVTIFANKPRSPKRRAARTSPRR